MSRSSRRNRKNTERGRISTTNELDSLLSLNPDYHRTFTPYTLKADSLDTLPVEVRDRRVHSPKAPQMRIQPAGRVNSSRLGGFSIQKLIVQKYPWIICRRRQERKEVLHAKYKNSGGIGSHRKEFKNPIQTIYSKVVCGK